MAQVRKLQVGGTTTEPYKINTVTPKQYFQVGNEAYDLGKYKDLVWHNFDSWIESEGYDSSIKDKSRKFINEILESLTTNEAHFNPDLTLTAKDNKNNWDPTTGFNKKGPRWLHWIATDIVDDQRGIPHVAMRYLNKVLTSRAMQNYKKPEQVALSDLTGKVFDKLIQRDFNNNWASFQSDWQLMSKPDKIRIFRDALKDFKNSTDFSIYTGQSVQELGPKIDEFIKYLDTIPELDQKFLDKASSLGFYGLNKWMQYQEPSKEDTDADNANNADNAEEVAKEQQAKANLAKATRVLTLKDVDSVIFPDISQHINYFNSTNQVDFFKNSLSKNIHTLVAFKVKNLKDIIQNPYTYDRWARSAFRGDSEKAHSYLNEVSKYVNRYLMGQSTPYNRQQINNVIEVMLNEAGHDNNGFTSFTGQTKNGFFYLTKSYDPVTQTYLAINNNPDSQYYGTIFAIPAIFVSSNNFWASTANKLNQYLKSNNRGAGYVQEYNPKQVYNIGLLSFYKNKVVQGNLKEFLEKVLNINDYPKLAKGGIIKAANGFQIFGDTPSGKPISQIPKEETKKVDTSKQDYIKRQNAEIKSWKDLKDNLDIHDAAVVGTLLFDLVALGGSLSGGAFNPVTDIATLGSMVGTIATVSTDKSMNLLEKIGYGTLGVALDATSLIPELGALGKSAKLGFMAKKAVPVLMGAIRYGGMGLAGAQALGPLKKLYDGETLTKNDWTRLAYFAQGMIMGTLGTRAARGGNKYTVATGEKTNYQLKTKSGWQNVSKEVYNKYNGKSVKEIKPSEEGKPLFTTNEGMEVHLGDLKPALKSRTVQGKVTPTNSGYRLKTPEEVGEMLGIKPMTVNGKPYYALPANYSRVKYRMESNADKSISSIFRAKVEVPLVNSRGDIVLKSNGEPMLVTVSQRRAKQMSELYNSKHGESKQPAIEEPTPKVEESTPKAQPKEETNKAVEDTPKANNSEKTTETTSTNSKVEDKSNPKTEPKTESKTPDVQKPKVEENISIRPQNIDQEVYKSIVLNHNRLGRSREVREKLEALVKQSKNKVPLKVIKPGHAYYYSPKRQSYIPTQYKNLKTKQELRKKLKENAIKFAGGGLFDNFKLKLPWNTKISTDDLNSTITGINGPINWKGLNTVSWPSYRTWQDRLKDEFTKGTKKQISTTYDPEDPDKKEKWYDYIPGYINRYTSPHHLLAIGSAAWAIQNARKVRDIKNSAVIPALDAVNNNIAYQPTFAAQKDFEINQAIGESNTSASKALSGDIRDYYANLYANNLLNRQLTAQKLKDRATEFQTNQENINNTINTLRSNQITTANSNNQKVIAANASKAANEEEFQNRKDQSILNVLGMYQEEETSREKARNILGQYALKTYYDSFSDEVAKYNTALKSYNDAKKKFENDYRKKLGATGTFNKNDFEKTWLESDQAKQLAEEIKKYSTVKDMNWYQLLMKGTNPGFHRYYYDLMNNKAKEFSIKDPNWYKQGGSLSYEQRMSLKQQDAINKMISTDKKERNSVKRELIREYNKNMRLVSKRSETLLKAAIGIK